MHILQHTSCFYVCIYIYIYLCIQSISQYKDASSALVVVWHRSGGPPIVVFFCFCGALPIVFWQGKSVLCCFFFPGLKQCAVEAILIQICTMKKNPKHASYNNSLAPLQTSIFDLFREVCWIKIPLEKLNWMRGKTYLKQINFLGPSLPKRGSMHPVQTHMHLGLSMTCKGVTIRLCVGNPFSWRCPQNWRVYKLDDVCHGIYNRGEPITIANRGFFLGWPHRTLISHHKKDSLKLSS